MANIEGKIVLTGGPCAGKTSALSRIEEYFTELGYKVLIVGESATELIKGGAKPFGDKALSMIDFQDIILNYQLQKEAMYDNIACKFKDTDKVIIIYDRGLMDNSAYISDSQFNSLLESNHLTKLELMDRYDMVLHLVTAADGAEAFYTLENNEARSEGIDEAIRLDRKTMTAWQGHQNLQIIDNSVSFEEKMNSVIRNIANLLGINNCVKYQTKYLVDAQSISQEFLKKALSIQIKQTYLGSDSYERRLRKRTLDGVDSYYFTVQKHGLEGSSKLVVDKKISKKDYYQLLSYYPDYRSISKTRFCFIYQKQQFRLDLFEDGIAILETNSNKVILPKDIIITQEITNDMSFYNHNLAKGRENKSKKG